MDVAIVGGGVFGCVIGRSLKEAGCDVTVFDCRRKEAASRASGFLMKPSWFAGLGKDVYKPSLDILDKLYSLQKIKFRVGPIRTSVWRVEREQVLDDPKLHYVEKKVTKVTDGHIIVEEERKEYDLIVVAAGIWSSKLLPVDILGKKGVSFEWKGSVKRSFIRPWAPYKQVVVFNVPDKNKIWAGDGSAIKPDNWTDEREKQCLQRVAKAADLDPTEVVRVNVGIRPFVQGKSCIVEKRGKHLWVATGGAKNGTILAGWAASRIVEATQ